MAKITNIRALGAPGTVCDMLNDLIRRAGTGEITQMAFVAIDDQGRMTAAWDDSAEMETLCCMKDFLVLEVARSLMGEQNGEDSEF
jgi:hypothetical protein